MDTISGETWEKAVVVLDPVVAGGGDLFQELLIYCPPTECGAPRHVLRMAPVDFFKLATGELIECRFKTVLDGCNDTLTAPTG